MKTVASPQGVPHRLRRSHPLRKVSPVPPLLFPRGATTASLPCDASFSKAVSLARHVGPSARDLRSFILFDFISFFNIFLFSRARGDWRCLRGASGFDASRSLAICWDSDVMTLENAGRSRNSRAQPLGQQSCEAPRGPTRLDSARHTTEMPSLAFGSCPGILGCECGRSSPREIRARRTALGSSSVHPLFPRLPSVFLKWRCRAR